MGEMWRIRGGRPLHGTVKIPAAKNSVLPLLAAALLCGGPVTLREIPFLADVQASFDLLRGLGCTIREQCGNVTVSPTPQTGQVPEGPAKAMRSSVFYLAPLLHAVGWVTMPMPGGCNLGPRPIDIHLDGLVHMGAQVCWQKNTLTLRAPGGLVGMDYTLRLPSVGATETLLMAASRARGTTVLRNAACEPEVEDLAEFLRRCGAHITGDGTPVIVVHGVPKLSGTKYTPLPDRIAAATMACAVACAGGALKLENCCPGHLTPVLQLLCQAGCRVTCGPGGVEICCYGPLKAVDTVYAGVYPAFPTDAAPLAAAAMLTASGESVFEDTVFEHRFACAEGFAAMGAKVQEQGRTLKIAGVPGLHGAAAEALDLRGGAALVLAALGAQGESRITGLHHIQRGYSDLAGLLNSLGAQITEEQNP